MAGKELEAAKLRAGGGLSARGACSEVQAGGIIGLTGVNRASESFLIHSFTYKEMRN